MRSRIRWKNNILFCIFLMFLVTLIISLINIGKWIVDSNNTNNQIKNVQENIKIKQVKDNENTEIIEKDKNSIYSKYINLDLIDVDFNELKSINKQTKGWIQVNGTNINYPFVQSKDNSYYLKHSFDKSYNSAGWVFLDYRNDLSKNDKNTILYAHGRLNNTMFGPLKKILKSGWLNNSNNYVVKLSTEYENTLWQVFSVYQIPTTNDYIQINYKSNEEFLELAIMLKERSAYDFKTTINKNDQILTLSTCYNNHEKVVLHAKLIKREKK